MADPTSLVIQPVLSFILKTTTSLIKDEYSMVHGVKEEIKNLESKLTSIQGVVEDAENKQVNDPHLKDWLRKLQEAASDAEDILDTFATEAYRWKQKQKERKIQPPLSKSEISYKRDAAQTIKKISERFDRIAKEKEAFHLDIKVNGGETQSPSYTGYFVDKSDVVGREDDKERITHMLLSNEFDKEGDVSVIPIIGMGGLGKTTLAQLIFNDDRVKEHFEARMWVCVTVQFDLTRILKEMIQFHSKMKLDDSSTSHLQTRLLEYLVGQRFLLVLDDVWTEDYLKWEPLKDLLKKGAKGSRVLVTSRITKVKDIIGTQPPHLLSYLPEEECWSLFAKIAFKGDSLSSQRLKVLEEIGREIVRKCKGLPLAVKAMGGLLRGCVDDLNKWRQIGSSEIWEIEDRNAGNDRPKILAILKLSYDHLPSHLKRCFAYCSLFPKAYTFHKEDLVKLWISQRFIQARGRETEEETGIAYFDELLIRSFFQVSVIEVKEKFNMHDLIHDLGLSISSPNCGLVNDNEPYSFSEQSRHVSLLGKDVEQPLLTIVENASKLRSLLFPSHYLKNFGQALEKVFRTLKYIRTLDLSSSIILELPSSIKELKLLRYLDLSRTEIKLLPKSICKLYNLETLKLLGCPWLFELPKDLGNLVNLRHLELDDLFWVKFSILPPKVGNLTNLHDWHAFQVGNKTGYGIEELKNMAYLSGTLHISKLENVDDVREAKMNEKKYLWKLVFEWSDRVVNTHDEATEKNVLEGLQPHSNLKELQIRHYRGNEFPAWMREGQLQNLISVTLNDCTNCKILTLGELPNLQLLYIKGMQELEKWPEVKCPSLSRLKFSNCPKLKELPEFFPNLRTLKIKRCTSLRALPVAPSLMFLKLIDNLVLEDWHEVMTTWVAVNGQGQRSSWHQGSWFKLLELNVISCPKLQALPQHFSPQKLEISGCELLVALPQPQFAQRLQHLALDSCHDGTLVRAIPNTSSLYSLVISGISNLNSLPKWPQLPGLKALYIRDCKDLVSLSENVEGSLRALVSLKHLSVRNCPMLVTLTEELPATLECLSIGSCPLLQSLGPKEILKSLPSLQDLYIEDCPKLNSLPEDGLPSSLQHLQIHGCQLLTERCQKEDGGGPDWPKVMHISDLEIDLPEVSSTTLPKKKPSAAAWCRRFLRSGGAIATEVNRSNSDVDKAVNEDLNEPKAEQEGTGSKESFPSTESKSSSTKDSSNGISKQASGLPQLVDEEEEKQETHLVPRSASKKVLEEKNITNPTSETIDNEDDDMESFYTSLGAKSETSPSTSSSVITDVQSQKTRPGQSEIDKALDIVKNVLATDFSSACHPGRSISLDSELELLCDLDENDGISVGMKFLVLQLSKDFKVLKSRYCQANDTIERCTNLIKPMAEIAFQLDANKQKFFELNSVEATIQKSIIEAEAQINELQKKLDTFPLAEQHMHDKQTMSTDGKSISGAEGQINELKQKIDSLSISGAEGQINELKQKIDSLTKRKGKGKQEKKMNFTDGKKLKEKMDVAAKAEEEKKEAERIKREIEEKWSDYNKQFETLTCSGGMTFS
ncbi:putative disease resistance protein RGA3 isoform X1 [Castanea sativa]|uniref:putative disease resistance protein RGA3 isoform X1 n=1 Tax=Castanea sativa TaxID=21020 RepID=UPI003F652982